METSYPTKKLGEVCDILDNLRKPITKRDRDPGPYPYYGATGIQDHVAGYIFDEDLILVGEDGARWDAGDKSAYKVSGKSWVNNHAHVLRPHKNIIHEDWLTYFLNISDLSGYITGTTVKKLNQAKLRSIEISLPPLSEQKKIVAKLEKLLAKVNEAKKLRAQAQESTNQLLPAELHKIFEEGRKKGWGEKVLGEVCEIARGGSPRPIKDYLTTDEDGINWIKISDATQSTKYIYKTKQKIRKEGLHQTRLVRSGDFILTNSMSFGRPYIMRTEGAIHDGWLVLRPQEGLLEEYMYHFLSSDEIYYQFSQLAGGAVVQNLNSGLVRSVKILIPPLSEQKKIVTRLDSISEKTKQLQEYQKTTSDDIIALEQSILSKAFSGKLI